jgi:cyclin-C
MLVLHQTARTTIQSQAQSQAQAAPQATRRSSRGHASGSGAQKRAPQDVIGFMAGLNVSMPLVATIAQEIIALYTLWDRYKEDAAPESGRSAFGSRASGGFAALGKRAAEKEADGVVTPAILTQLLLRMREARSADLAAQSASGRAVAVNKMLERTQAAG